MPVNNFEFEKADGIISSIKGQSVGRDPISAADIFDFVSIAQKGFGYEPDEEENMFGILYWNRANEPGMAGLTFEKALSMCKNDELFLIFTYDSVTWLTTSGYQAFTPTMYSYEYNNSNPDQITIYISTGVGFIWTAEGFEYFD